MRGQSRAVFQWEVSFRAIVRADALEEVSLDQTYTGSPYTPSLGLEPAKEEKESMSNHQMQNTEAEVKKKKTQLYWTKTEISSRKLEKLLIVAQRLKTALVNIQYMLWSLVKTHRLRRCRIKISPPDVKWIFEL